MTDLTHTELVEKVADIIDPKSKGPMREYRITQRELAESLAAEIVSTIAEALKEPTEAMVDAAEDLIAAFVHTDEIKDALISAHLASPLYPEGK